jgi:hypothetical protein
MGFAQVLKQSGGKNMFNIKDVIGWIGNLAVVKANGGYWLVNWANSNNRLFVTE